RCHGGASIRAAVRLAYWQGARVARPRLRRRVGAPPRWGAGAAGDLAGVGDRAVHLARAVANLACRARAVRFAAPELPVPADPRDGEPPVPPVASRDVGRLLGPGARARAQPAPLQLPALGDAVPRVAPVPAPPRRVREARTRPGAGRLCLAAVALAARLARAGRVLRHPVGAGAELGHRTRSAQPRLRAACAPRCRGLDRAERARARARAL